MKRFDRVDLEEVLVDLRLALRRLKEVREGVLDLARDRHPVEAHGLRQRHVVDVKPHEGLLDRAEGVALVLGIRQEARQPREVAIRQMHGAVRCTA